MIPSPARIEKDFAPRQQCEECEHELSTSDPRTRCPTCGGLLSLRLALPEGRARELRQRFDERGGPATRGALASGVWRYHELLPPFDLAGVTSYPEGNTPLVTRASVSAWADCEALWLKHEGMNPTGSFKDRGMTVAISQAVRVGASAAACASTGNTSASLAAYASQAGLPALVFVPAGNIAVGKLAQTLAYGARTLLVRGDFDRCLALAREAADELGVYTVNSVNPFRLEGQKTIAFELLHQLKWTAPDWIALPAGNLGNTSAIGKALLEARALGLIDRVPRILAVQAAGAAPFAQAFGEGFQRRIAVRAETVATAIRIGDPASWARAVQVITETRGHVLSVPDEEILEAKAIVDAAGVGCEPASAASVAGVRAARRSGTIAKGETVAAVLTGHVLKDPSTLTWFHQNLEPPPDRANRPMEIDATLEAVERALRPK